MSTYRVTYSILRDDEEIGFGSSMLSDDIESCGADIATDLQRGEWETQPGQPDPEDVLRTIATLIDGIES